MNGKDPFAELEIDETILAHEEEKGFEINDEDFLLPVLKPGDLKVSLPAHIKRSHKAEEDEWHFGILCAASDQVVLRVGTREAAALKRNKLYNARTYLKYSEANRLQDPTHRSELDNWTLVLKEHNKVWYVVAINLKLDNEWTEEAPWDKP